MSLYGLRIVPFLCFTLSEWIWLFNISESDFKEKYSLPIDIEYLENYIDFSLGLNIL